MLQSLLSVAYPDADRRAAEAHALIAHEVRRHAQTGSLHSSDDLCACLARLPQATLRDIRARCIYYAARNLIEALAHRRIRNNAIAREEAMLYVHDRLQRDDFRRITSFDTAGGASIKTYLWQVISRLLIDFVRSRAVDESLPDDQEDSIPSEARDGDAITAEQQLKEILRSVFVDHGAVLERSRTLRERLRERLHLSSHERLFLKALFQYDMPIEEIRALPGFAMSSSEAWRFYYRILDRLLETFKRADALAPLHAMIEASEPKLTLALDERRVEVAATSVHYVRAIDTASSSCEATWRGLLVRARIDDSFARLKKRLAPWFSPVNATTLIADRWLAAAAERFRDDTFEAIEIPGVAERFPIGRSQRAVLAERYAQKIATADSYTKTQTDDAPSLPEARRP